MDLLTRRRLLQRIGTAGSVVAGLPLLHRLRAADPLPKPVQVIVVGAGLAGLVAAYELEQKGHAVTILEADPKHFGERVRTHRDASIDRLPMTAIGIAPHATLAF